MKRLSTLLISVFLITAMIVSSLPVVSAEKKSDVLTLRISNCEEYIDEGGWDEEEDVIDLDSGDIFSDKSMIEEFEDWYYKTYGKKVRVEYSTYGTNEDLYNQITLGDRFDLVCPSDYMCMKMIGEGMAEPLSKDFFDTSREENYYANGVSPYIKNLMETTQIDGEKWSDYSAGYMWGTMGFVYNPEYVSEEDVTTWKLLQNKKYSRRITIKDSVRDTYFATLGLINSDTMLEESFKNSKDYNKNITSLMNDTSPKTIAKAEELLKEIKENVYSFETDSGKSDLVSGKVVGNFQWSGDAVYTMDQAEEDDCILEYSVPKECSNLWCDGWIMLKDGINGSKERKQASEAFINFISRPDNVIKNMYYIGYTSCISGGNDDRILEYVNWSFGAEDDEEETVDYPVGFFFADDESDEKYIIKTTPDQTKRQLFAQYPTSDILDRCAVMMYFDDRANERMNQMWINIRCFNLNSIPLSTYLLFAGAILLAVLATLLVVYRRRIFVKRIPKGYKKVG